MKTLLAPFLLALLSIAPARADVVNRFTPADDPIVVSRVTNAVSRLADQFPELQNVTLRSGMLDIDVYAEADGDTIIFNTSYIWSAAVFEHSIINDVQQGFHPALGHCSPEELTAYHEAAHIIDIRKNRRPSRELADRFGNGIGLNLSGYSFFWGVLDPVEALAEGFASTICSGGNPIEQLIYSFVRNS